MVNSTDKQVSFVQDLRQNGFSESLFGTERGCSDQAIGDILSGWRYDLSGVSAELISDYQGHLYECRHCRARQRLHRTIDLALMTLFTVSFFVFAAATMFIHHEPWAQLTFAQVHMRHLSLALTLQEVSVAGLVLSVLMWILVAVATPVPLLITNTLHERFTHDNDRAF